MSFTVNLIEDFCYSAWDENKILFSSFDWRAIKIKMNCVKKKNNKKNLNIQFIYCRKSKLKVFFFSVYLIVSIREIDVTFFILSWTPNFNDATVISKHICCYIHSFFNAVRTGLNLRIRTPDHKVYKKVLYEQISMACRFISENLKNV